MNCVSRMAPVFDRRVVQSILRKAGHRAANLRVQLPKGIDRRYSALLGRPQPFGLDSVVEAVMSIRRRGASRFYDEWMAEQRLLSVNVECYAGHRGEQTPRTLILGDRRIAVAEVLDAWLAPDYRYFKLKGADGDTYLVRHDERTGIWELTMFRAERFRPAT